YDDKAISKEDLIAVHLHTHKSTAAHSMRKKYRSAIYTFTDADRTEAEQLLKKLQKDFKNQLITKVLPFQDFKPSDKMFHEYYYSNPEKPFCSSYIAPKLKLLLDTFSKNVDKAKLTV
ncbi:MAG: peptide-methionine (S)-S-oxide reductase, partial [Bacteroidota bacterium]